MSARHTIQDMQLWASRKGGKCLSKEYWAIDTKLTWMCAKGHTWDTAPKYIRVGNWCPVCSRDRRKGTIEQMQSIATERSGKCLSKKYINKDVRLEWKCKSNHVWKSTANSVKRGSWCPYCYGNARHTIEQMRQLAKELGGKCLSKKYINKETKLKWKCAKGHLWQASPGTITHQKSWCPVCARKKMGNKSKKYTLKEVRKVAKEKKGKCLSKKYTNIDTLLKWQCARGHVWEARFYTVLHHDSWCGKCRGIDRSTKHKYLQK